MMEEVFVLSDAGVKKFLVTILSNLKNISSMALYLFVIILGVFLVISIAKALIQ